MRHTKRWVEWKQSSRRPDIQVRRYVDVTAPTNVLQLSGGGPATASQTTSHPNVAHLKALSNVIDHAMAILPTQRFDEIVKDIGEIRINECIAAVDYIIAELNARIQSTNARN